MIPAAMKTVIQSRLAPFRHSDFRNFFMVQTMSMVGTFSHDLARAWIIGQMFGKSGALGSLYLSIAAPTLMFILYAGVLVDRTNVRRVIMWTKGLLGLACLVLAAVTEFGHLEYWHLLVFGIVEGLIMAFDAPSFQALTVRLVPREDFQQAIAVNSTNFHASRMLGPLFAVFLFQFHGPSLVFLFDGLTYAGVMLVLSRVNLRQVPRKTCEQDGRALREGLEYMFANPMIRYRLLQLMLTLCFAYPLLLSVYRIYVMQRFNLNVQEFGGVFAFPAIGSLCGALSFALVKPKNPLKALLIGAPALTVSLFLMPFVTHVTVACLVMGLTGFFMYLDMSALSVSLQLEVDESYRGRLSSVIGMGFLCFGPMMSAPWGHLADIYGPQRIMILSAACFGGLTATLALTYWQNFRLKAAAVPVTE